MLECTDKADAKRKVSRKGSHLTITLSASETLRSVRSLSEQIGSALDDERVKTIALNGSQTEVADCSFYQLVIAATSRAHLQGKHLIVSGLGSNLVNIATMFGLHVPTDSPNSDREAS